MFLVHNEFSLLFEWFLVKKKYFDKILFGLARRAFWTTVHCTLCLFCSTIWTNCAASILLDGKSLYIHRWCIVYNKISIVIIVGGSIPYYDCEWPWITVSEWLTDWLNFVYLAHFFSDFLGWLASNLHEIQDLSRAWLALQTSFSDWIDSVTFHLVNFQNTVFEIVKDPSE